MEAQDSPPSKKEKAVQLAGKVMASLYWNSMGIIMIDYLAKGRAITGLFKSPAGTERENSREAGYGQK